jgi:hypothetical protein
VIERADAAMVIARLRLRGGIPMPLARTNPGIRRPIPPSRRMAGPAIADATRSVWSGRTHRGNIQ